MAQIKGEYKGLCNRTACQSPVDVEYYNYSTKQYYCPVCAFLINDANRKDALKMFGHELCLPIRREADRPELKINK